MPVKKPYTHVRLILHEDGRGLMDRYEVRVSTFVEFDHDKGRRAISGHPTKEQALEIAQELARTERGTIEGTSMNQSLLDVLENHKKQIEYAEERIRMYKNGEMGLWDTTPPRDTTEEAIQAERKLIEDYRNAIEIIERMLKDKKS